MTCHKPTTCHAGRCWICDPSIHYCGRPYADHELETGRLIGCKTTTERRDS